MMGMVGTWALWMVVGKVGTGRDRKAIAFCTVGIALSLVVASVEGRVGSIRWEIETCHGSGSYSCSVCPAACTEIRYYSLVLG